MFLSVGVLNLSINRRMSQSVGFPSPYLGVTFQHFDPLSGDEEIHLEHRLSCSLTILSKQLKTDSDMFTELNHLLLFSLTAL